MSILLDASTRVIVQGITGREGTFHAGQMIEMGTKVVGGTSPGKGGTTHLGVPVFNTVADAVKATGANASGIFVPPPFAADAIMEAAAAGIALIVCITEGIPIQEMIKVKDFLRGYPSARLIGANCPGLITPGVGKIGIIPQRITSAGHVGLVSRSGTLTYEVASALTAAGHGPVHDRRHRRRPGPRPDVQGCRRALREGPGDHAPRGDRRDRRQRRGARGRAAGRAASRLKTVAFISGRTAPEGKRMGHAGAIVSGNRGTAKSKVEAFQKAGRRRRRDHRRHRRPAAIGSARG